MKELKIVRNLNEETRKQGIWVRCRDGRIEIYSLHILSDEVIITDNNDYTKIYALYSIDYCNEQ